MKKEKLNLVMKKLFLLYANNKDSGQPANAQADQRLC